MEENHDCESDKTNIIGEFILLSEIRTKEIIDISLMHAHKKRKKKR